MNYLGSLPFGLNANMSVNTDKQGMYGPNAMQLPGAYGGDPYSVVGNSPVGASGYDPLNIQNYRQTMLQFMPPQPANPYQGMTPFGNHYTRYLMGGGQRMNRLARPYGSDRPFAPDNGKFGPRTYANSAYGMQGVSSPYDSVG